LKGADAELDTMNTENDLDINNNVEEWKLLTIAMVDNILVMWQGSQNLPVTQSQSHTQNKQLTTVSYISESEEIVNTFCSLFQHDVAAAFE
jgi:hypothetical protein